MVKNVLKAIGVNVNNRKAQSNKIPNEITKIAIKEARASKVTRAESVDKLFKSI